MSRLQQPSSKSSIFVFGFSVGFFFVQSSLVFSNSMETPQTTKIRDIVVENIKKKNE